MHFSSLDNFCVCVCVRVDDKKIKMHFQVEDIALCRLLGSLPSYNSHTLTNLSEVTYKILLDDDNVSRLPLSYRY